MLPQLRGPSRGRSVRCLLDVREQDRHRMAPVLHAAQLGEAEPFQRGAGGERVWPRMGGSTVATSGQLTSRPRSISSGSDAEPPGRKGAG